MPNACHPAKRLCIAGNLRALFLPKSLRKVSGASVLRASPPLPKGRDNRENLKDQRHQQLQSFRPSEIHISDVSVPSNAENSAVVRVRRFWQRNFPSAVWQNKTDFTNWYIRKSIILTLALTLIMMWKHRQEMRPPDRIGADHFVKLRVISRTHIGPDALLIQLDLPTDALPVDSGGAPASSNVPIQSIYIADPDSMIQRPYTPLFSDVFDPCSPENTGKLSLAVRKYDQGELSKYLHTRAIGAMVPIRGPVWTWDFRHKAMDDLIFVRRANDGCFFAVALTRTPKIVAGTGCTPALQTMAALYDPPDLGFEQNELLWGKKKNSRLALEQKSLAENAVGASINLAPEIASEQAVGDMSWTDRLWARFNANQRGEAPTIARRQNLRVAPPRITVLYASSTSDGILLRSTMKAYQDRHPGRIRIACWADKLNDPKHAHWVVREGQIGLQDLINYGGRRETYPDPEKAVIVVCGPDGFIDQMAGSRSRDSGPDDEKSPVGGLLSILGWKPEQVVRLNNGPQTEQRVATS